MKGLLVDSNDILHIRLPKSSPPSFPRPHPGPTVLLVALVVVISVPAVNLTIHNTNPLIVAKYNSKTCL
jgi:hypothetical protein